MGHLESWQMAVALRDEAEASLSNLTGSPAPQGHQHQGGGKPRAQAGPGAA